MLFMRPRVILANAISLNGSLTGYAVDYGVYSPHLLANHPDAVLVGAATILAASVAIPPGEAGDFGKRPDRPDETRPWWVVVDSRERLVPCTLLLPENGVHEGYYRAGL